jgi:hypothetical protein
MLLALLFTLAAPVSVASDTLFAVEVYGLRTVSEAAIRSAIGTRAGDPVPKDHEAVRSRVRAVTGVAQVDVSVVCCSQSGTPIMYVGVRESGVPPTTYRTSPNGDARLPSELLAVGARFASAMEAAVRRGSGAEDHSRGYALSEDSAVRSIQLEFIDIAARDFDLLSSVLEHSADATHRALAVQILAYGRNKQEIVRHLLHAADDHDEVVRNNSVRALGVLAQWANESASPGVSIPPDPFIKLLNSVFWTDRNKGVFLLMSLSASREPALLDKLRTESSESLIEMARWCNPGHALGPYMILARIVGMEDGEAFQAWQQGDKETVIRRGQALSAEVNQVRQSAEP